MPGRSPSGMTCCPSEPLPRAGAGGAGEKPNARQKLPLEAKVHYTVFLFPVSKAPDGGDDVRATGGLEGTGQDLRAVPEEERERKALRGPRGPEDDKELHQSFLRAPERGGTLSPQAAEPKAQTLGQTAGVHRRCSGQKGGRIFTPVPPAVRSARPVLEEAEGEHVGVPGPGWDGGSPDRVFLAQPRRGQPACDLPAPGSSAQHLIAPGPGGTQPIRARRGGFSRLTVGGIPTRRSRACSLRVPERRAGSVSGHACPGVWGAVSGLPRAGPGAPSEPLRAPPAGCSVWLRLEGAARASPRPAGLKASLRG